MRAPAAVALASASLALGLAASSPSLARPPRSDPAPSAVRLLEVRRIRAHFDSVLAELPARDGSALTAAQRERRAALLAALRAYRDRGEFPHN